MQTSCSRPRILLLPLSALQESKGAPRLKRLVLCCLQRTNASALRTPMSSSAASQPQEQITLPARRHLMVSQRKIKSCWSCLQQEAIDTSMVPNTCYGGLWQLRVPRVRGHLALTPPIRSAACTVMCWLPTSHPAGPGGSNVWP